MNTSKDYPQSYDEFSASVDLYPEEVKLTAYTLGLGNEVGELQGKIKKYFRGDYQLTKEVKEQMASELGDVLWYLTRLANYLGYCLDDVVDMNVEKLSSRKERNTIKGDGDNR